MSGMFNGQTGTIYLCSELVRLRYRVPPGTECTTVANLEEIAETGASVLLDVPLQKGLSVTVQCREHVLRGVVDSWTYDELGYTTWIRFDADSLWSPDRFRPKHLLNPQELVKGRAKSASTGVNTTRRVAS